MTMGRSTMRLLRGIDAGLAGGTGAENRQVVYTSTEAVLGGDALPHRGDNIIGQFPLLAAGSADEVVVAFLDELVFAGAAAEIGLADQAEITQEFEVAVDGAAVEAGDGSLDAGVDLIGGEVPPLLQCAKDDQTLRGGALADRAQAPGEVLPIASGTIDGQWLSHMVLTVLCGGKVAMSAFSVSQITHRPLTGMIRDFTLRTM